jgi:hypothetical protein
MPTFDDHHDPDRPVCRHIRTKALHVYGHDTPDAFSTSRSSHYHCLRTQFVTGPDAALCVPEDCQPGRTCFEDR